MKKWEWLSEKSRDACEFGDSAMRISCETIDGLIIDYEKLKADNESLRRDAERYRRMRALTLKQIDDTQDEFDLAFDSQISSAENS